MVRPNFPRPQLENLSQPKRGLAAFAIGLAFTSGAVGVEAGYNQLVLPSPKEVPADMYEQQRDNLVRPEIFLDAILLAAVTAGRLHKWKLRRQDAMPLFRYNGDPRRVK
jgi:hypothetical protein